MALFQSSSESVSTVPSGVTVAATLTSVVSLERQRRAAAAGDGARHRLRFGRIEVGDGDLGSFRGEAPTDRAADLATAAGDQGDPLRQPAPARHQLVACWTKLPSKIADLGGNGFLIKPISTSPSAIFS